MDVLREKLLQYLSEQHPPLVEYKELEDWYSEIDTTSCCSSKDSLGVALDGLVKEDKLKQRVITGNDSSCDIYWLNISKPKGVTHTQYPVKRKFVSPLAVNKRFKCSQRTNDYITNEEGLTHKKIADDILKLQKERDKYKKELSEREGHLHKLQLVKLYRSKNDLNELEVLIRKWRDVSQTAAIELLDLSPADPKPNMSLMLNYLHIDPNVIQYCIDDESFY